MHIQNQKLYYPFLCKYARTYWLLATTAYYIWRFLLPGLYIEEQILSHLNSYSNSIITIVHLRLLYLASLICLFIDIYMFNHYHGHNHGKLWIPQNTLQMLHINHTRTSLYTWDAAIQMGMFMFVLHQVPNSFN